MRASAAAAHSAARRRGGHRILLVLTISGDECELQTAHGEVPATAAVAANDTVMLSAARTCDAGHVPILVVGQESLPYIAVVEPSA